MKIILKRILALAFVGALVACASKPERASPVAVGSEQSSQPPTRIFSDPKVVTAPNPVSSLLDNAQREIDDKDYEGAEAKALRAQRLSPQEPLSYYLLAQVRLAQERFAEAEQLALRALALVQGNGELKQEIDRFLAQW